MAHQITHVRRDQNGVTVAVRSPVLGYETVSTVVFAIESRLRSYYTVHAGQRAEVVVAISSLGRKYLKSTPDGTTRNNLDYLPDF